MLVTTARYAFAFAVGFLALGLEIQAQENATLWALENAVPTKTFVSQQWETRSEVSELSTICTNPGGSCG